MSDWADKGHVGGTVLDQEAHEGECEAGGVISLCGCVISLWGCVISLRGGVIWSMFLQLKIST